MEVSSESKGRLLFAVAVMGFSGLVAQIVLLRELLITFYGNELSIGIVLANWLILEALGCFFLGRAIDRFRSRTAVFAAASVAFSLLLPAAVFLTRMLKEIMGALAGEGIGIVPVIYSSFLVLMPVSVLHGALFTFGCRICSSSEEEGPAVIGRVYIWETLGTIVAGVALMWLLIPRFDSMQTAFFVAMLNFLMCALLLGPFRRGAGRASRALGGASVVLLLLAGALFFSGGVEWLNRRSIERQWRGQNVVHYENSVYGNVAVVEREEELTFFANGIPLFTTPHPDAVFVQEFAHFSLLSHPGPRRVLVASGGVGGLIREILKHPVERVDYVELDPLLLELAERFSTPLTREELGDPRVNVAFDDGRLFIKRSASEYDAVLVGISNPQELQTNRFFTREFFIVARQALGEGGLLAFNLPGSLAYLGEELRDLNSCIHATLKGVFPFVRVIPGDGTNLYLGCDTEEACSAGPEELARRLGSRGVDSGLLTKGHLEYRLDPRREEWFFSSLEEGTSRANEDFRPAGVFYSLMYWNALFSPGVNRLFAPLKEAGLLSVAAPASLLILLLLFLGLRSARVRRAGVPFAIATTGFAGMIFDLVLIFAFQALYGYVFYWVGLLVTAFMAGAAAGGGLATRLLERTRRELAFFTGLDAAVGLYSCLLGVVFFLFLPYLVREMTPAFMHGCFLVLSLLSGLLVGAQFPLAGKIHLRESGRFSGTAGLLYGADLFGGWIGGIAGGVLMLPVLGLFQTCMVAAILKAGSFVLLCFFSGRSE